MRWIRALALVAAAVACGCHAPVYEVRMQPTGMPRDRYVSPAAVDLPDPQTPHERAQLEVDWPPVHPLSVPLDRGFQRVTRGGGVWGLPVRACRETGHCP